MKDKAGKPRITLVPHKIVEAIANVRMYGVEKYGDVDCWKSVSVEDYMDAIGRHYGKLVDGEERDDESGLPHIWHIACNCAFIIYLKWNEHDRHLPELRWKRHTDGTHHTYQCPICHEIFDAPHERCPDCLTVLRRD